MTLTTSLALLLAPTWLNVFFPILLNLPTYSSIYLYLLVCLFFDLPALYVTSIRTGILSFIYINLKWPEECLALKRLSANTILNVQLPTPHTTCKALHVLTYSGLSLLSPPILYGTLDQCCLKEIQCKPICNLKSRNHI